jgi:hypothetical protein
MPVSPGIWEMAFLRYATFSLSKLEIDTPHHVKRRIADADGCQGLPDLQKDFYEKCVSIDLNIPICYKTV